MDGGLRSGCRSGSGGDGQTCPTTRAAARTPCASRTRLAAEARGAAVCPMRCAAPIAEQPGIASRSGASLRIQGLQLAFQRVDLNGQLTTTRELLQAMRLRFVCAAGEEHLERSSHT